MITSSLARLGVTALIVGSLIGCLLCFPMIAHARTLQGAAGSTASYYGPDYDPDPDDDYEAEDDGSETYDPVEQARLKKQYDDYNAKHNLKEFSGLPRACKDQYCTSYVNGSD